MRRRANSALVAYCGLLGLPKVLADKGCFRKLLASADTLRAASRGQEGWTRHAIGSISWTRALCRNSSLGVQAAVPRARTQAPGYTYHSSPANENHTRQHVSEQGRTIRPREPIALTASPVASSLASGTCSAMCGTAAAPNRSSAVCDPATVHLTNSLDFA